MTSDFEGFPLHLFSYLNFSERASISLFMLSAKQGNYWYHYYTVFGTTRSLTGDLIRDLPHSKASTLTLGYRGGGLNLIKNACQISAHAELLTVKYRRI